MKLDASAWTDPGKQRDTNEDRVWSQVFTDSRGVTLGLLVVCDGMGGHLGGECASYWAVETIKREMSSLFCPGDPRATVQLPSEEMQRALQSRDTASKMTDNKIEKLALKAIQRANQVVYQYAQQKPEQAADAGTTLAMAVVYGKKALIANVGDSRTYLMRGQQLRQISSDHSLVARLVERGQIEPHEVYTHPQRSLIYRSLGQKEQVQVDIFRETLQPDDVILLCSDGLWEMVRDPAWLVQAITSSQSLEQACKELVEAANAAGGEDNIAVVLARLS
jgi:protein phosphatase